MEAVEEYIVFVAPAIALAAEEAVSVAFNISQMYQNTAKTLLLAGELKRSFTVMEQRWGSDGSASLLPVLSFGTTLELAGEGCEQLMAQAVRSFTKGVGVDRGHICSPLHPASQSIGSQHALHSDETGAVGAARGDRLTVWSVDAFPSVTPSSTQVGAAMTHLSHLGLTTTLIKVGVTGSGMHTDADALLSLVDASTRAFTRVLGRAVTAAFAPPSGEAQAGTDYRNASTVTSSYGDSSSAVDSVSVLSVLNDRLSMRLLSCHRIRETLPPMLATLALQRVVQTTATATATVVGGGVQSTPQPATHSPPLTAQLVLVVLHLQLRPLAIVSEASYVASESALALQLHGCLRQGDLDSAWLHSPGYSVEVSPSSHALGATGSAASTVCAAAEWSTALVALRSHGSGLLLKSCEPCDSRVGAPTYTLWFALVVSGEEGDVPVATLFRLVTSEQYIGSHISGGSAYSAHISGEASTLAALIAATSPATGLTHTNTLLQSMSALPLLTYSPLDYSCGLTTTRLLSAFASHGATGLRRRILTRATPRKPTATQAQASTTAVAVGGGIFPLAAAGILAPGSDGEVSYDWDVGIMPHILSGDTSGAATGGAVYPTSTTAIGTDGRLVSAAANGAARRNNMTSISMLHTTAAPSSSKPTSTSRKPAVKVGGKATKPVLHSGSETFRGQLDYWHGTGTQFGSALGRSAPAAHLASDGHAFATTAASTIPQAAPRQGEGGGGSARAPFSTTAVQPHTQLVFPSTSTSMTATGNQSGAVQVKRRRLTKATATNRGSPRPTITTARAATAITARGGGSGGKSAAAVMMDGSVGALPPPRHSDDDHDVERMLLQLGDVDLQGLLHQADECDEGGLSDTVREEEGAIGDTAATPAHLPADGAVLAALAIPQDVSTTAFMSSRWLADTLSHPHAAVETAPTGKSKSSQYMPTSGSSGSGSGVRTRVFVMPKLPPPPAEGTVAVAVPVERVAPPLPIGSGSIMMMPSTHPHTSDSVSGASVTVPTKSQGVSGTSGSLLSRLTGVASDFDFSDEEL